MFKRLKQTGLALVVLLGAMILVGSAVHALYPSNWLAVPAVVQSTEVTSVRNGVVEWAVRVDATYEVSGQRHKTSQDMFLDTEWEVASREAERWLAGREFTLYADAENPGSVSKSPDGGREAVTVVSVLFTPVTVFFIWLFLVVRRRRRNEKRASGA